MKRTKECREHKKEGRKMNRRIVWLIVWMVPLLLGMLPAHVWAAHPVGAVLEPIPDPWVGTYYAGRRPGGTPTLVRNDPAIDFDWGYTAPAAGLDAEAFSARWESRYYLAGGAYRFYATSDDGIRAWLDGEPLLDEWHAVPGLTYTVERVLTGGYHHFRVEYYEAGGHARVRFWWERITRPAYYPDWKAEYYANASLDGRPVLVRNDPAIDFNWRDSSPLAGISPERFSVRWSRQVHLEEGVYRFDLTVYGEVVVWVDEAVVLDVRGQGSDREFSALAAVERGEHTIKVEYFKTGGDARIHLEWALSEKDSYPDWKAEYFNNRLLQGKPALVRNDAVPVFDWGEKAPDPALPQDNFAVRWSRTKEFPAGTYLFYARVDDGVRVYVDGVLVLDGWTFGRGVQEFTARVTLTEGEHQVVVEYFDRRGKAEITFWWVREE